MIEEVCQAAKDSREDQQSNRIDKEQEVLVVSLRNAIANPRTMMVELQVASPASVTMNCPQRAIDLTFEACFQFLQSTVVYDNPVALRANKLPDVVKLRFTDPLAKLSCRNSAGVTESAKADSNVSDEKQCSLQPKEVGNPDYIQLCTVCEQASNADRVDDKESDEAVVWRRSSEAFAFAEELLVSEPLVVLSDL